MTTILEHLRQLLIFVAVCLTGGCISLDDPGVEKPISAAPDVPGPAASVERRLDYRLPARVTLCGESLDLQKRSVYERLDNEFIRIVNHPAQVALWQRRAAIFFPKIEAGLKAAGLPDDLKYLAMAESDLRPWVVSPSGALGIWQFMPATARHFGLTVSPKIDQRQLSETSLTAATKYLRSLRGKFGSWSLAMAAYNAGDGRIARAVSAQGTNDYYQLDLPRETERYVYRIAAIKVVMENSAGYGLSSPVPRAHYQPAAYVEKTVDFKTAIAWPALAKKLGCDYKELRLLNPHIRTASLSGSYQFRVPPGVEKKLAE
ncbi:murein transglycosylase [Deltaproteobacteria bacterium Smac51]|nr:murein transglycosylase [Deltaproteobacteria bacterium Smac51]